MKGRYRLEITDWSPNKVPNHVYITEGTNLLGYIPISGGKEMRFTVPKRHWSPSKRKFRDLTKAELRWIDEHKTFKEGG